MKGPFYFSQSFSALFPCFLIVECVSITLAGYELCVNRGEYDSGLVPARITLFSFIKIHYSFWCLTFHVECETIVVKGSTNLEDLIDSLFEHVLFPF